MKLGPDVMHYVTAVDFSQTHKGQLRTEYENYYTQLLLKNIVEMAFQKKRLFFVEKLSSLR